MILTVLKQFYKQIVVRDKNPNKDTSMDIQKTAKVIYLCLMSLPTQNLSYQFDFNILKMFTFSGNKFILILKIQSYTGF